MTTALEEYHQLANELDELHSVVTQKERRMMEIEELAMNEHAALNGICMHAPLMNTPEFRARNRVFAKDDVLTPVEATWAGVWLEAYHGQARIRNWVTYAEVALLRKPQIVEK